MEINRVLVYLLLSTIVLLSIGKVCAEKRDANTIHLISRYL